MVSTWYALKIVDRFLHSFVRFVCWCVGRSREAKCWTVNWSPSDSMFLATFETLAKQQIQQVVCDLPDQMGGLGGKRSKETVCIQYVIFEVQTTCWCFRGHPEGMAAVQISDLLSAAESCRRKRLGVAGDSEKTTPWWNQEVKEAFRAKKNAFKALLQDRSSSDLQSRYTEARKAATLAVKKSKEKSREEFGHRLNSNYFSAHKVFRQISTVFVTKDRVSRTPSRIPSSLCSRKWQAIKTVPCSCLQGLREGGAGGDNDRGAHGL